MFCQNCGSEIKENQKFCKKCGMPVPKLSENITDLNKAVARSVITKKDTDQTDTLLPGNNNEKAKMPKSKKIKIIVISVVVALAVVIASLTASFFTSPAYKIYKNLKNAECETAVQIYETKVENSFIQKILFNIIINDYEDKVVQDFKDGEIEYDEAIDILKAMKSMGIDDISELIDEVDRLSGNSQNGKKDKSNKDEEDAQKPETTTQASSAEALNFNFKVGFIYLHDENSTYDLNFMQAAKAACDKYGVTYIEKTNVPESEDCYDAAEELVQMGCKILFADSYGHETLLLKSAKNHPDVQFCHASGVQAHTAGVSNFHNAYAKTYEGSYICGVAAGVKLNDMIVMSEIRAEDAKLGYVGTFEYSDCISDYTAFYLGAKSVCPTVTMDVQFTRSFYDETKEKEAAELLIKRGCKVISQHADSLGAPTACEQAGVPNISYNGSTSSACPNTFLMSYSINWQPYFEYIIKCVAGNKAIDTDWCGGIAQGSIEFGALNVRIAGTDTDVAIKKTKTDITNGTVKVFDTDAFTVEGKKLTSYIADVNFDPSYNPDTEIVKDGYVHECEYRSAPYFDIHIDGIQLLNQAY